MKKYMVIVELGNKRINQLIKWADDAEHAKKLALKDWRIDPEMAKSITVKQELH